MGCPHGSRCPSTHLLQRGVLDSVGVVVVVDDLEVGNGWAGPRPHEAHVQGGLPRPPRLHAEVGGGPHLHPCTTSSSHCGTHGTHSPCPIAPRCGWGSLTATPAPRVSHVGPAPLTVPSSQHPSPPPHVPTPPHWPLTRPAEPRSLGFDLGGVVGWVHLDAEGAGGDLLGTKARPQ